MQVVMVVGIKGGVGKTLAADEIAFEFDRNGFPYAWFTLDEQRSSSHEDHENPTDPQIVIVDTPSNMGGKTISQLKDLDAGDLVIIATQATAKDIYTLEQTIRTVKNATDAQILYLIDRWRNGTKMPKEFLDDYFLTHVTDDPEDYVIIPESTRVQQAEALRTSVIDQARKEPVGKAVEELVTKALAKLTKGRKTAGQ